ncbi:transposase [bacterium]|nr:transposase [bacterium]MBU1025973.1 transposase [bacterium]
MTEKKRQGKRHSEEQIVRILREIELGRTISDVCREYGISDQTYRNWKNKYGGMELGDIKEMRRLQSENARLKRIVAEQTLEIESIKELLSKKW